MGVGGGVVRGDARSYGLHPLVGMGERGRSAGDPAGRTPVRPCLGVRRNHDAFGKDPVECRGIAHSAAFRDRPPRVSRRRFRCVDHPITLWGRARPVSRACRGWRAVCGNAVDPVHRTLPGDVLSRPPVRAAGTRVWQIWSRCAAHDRHGRRICRGRAVDRGVRLFSRTPKCTRAAARLGRSDRTPRRTLAHDPALVAVAENEHRRTQTRAHPANGCCVLRLDGPRLAAPHRAPGDRAGDGSVVAVRKTGALAACILVRRFGGAGAWRWRCGRVRIQARIHRRDVAGSPRRRPGVVAFLHVLLVRRSRRSRRGRNRS